MLRPVEVRRRQTIDRVADERPVHEVPRLEDRQAGNGLEARRHEVVASPPTRMHVGVGVVGEDHDLRRRAEPGRADKGQTNSEDTLLP